MPKRAWEWSRRIHFGAGRAVALDWGVELWNWDVSRYESADAIRTAFILAGQPVDDNRILYDATAGLLDDVVDAAGGVEYAYERLQSAASRLQEVATHLSATHGVIRDGVGLSHRSGEDAWYSLEEMLVWARTLDDRLGRRPTDRKNYPDQGLIPALADGPRRDAVIRARNRLLQNGVREARYIVGLNLHMQSSQAGSKHGRVRDGKVIFAFPDRVTAQIGHRWQLTYDEGRDVVSFADGLMTAVERFMDGMLMAFEQNLPERFGPPPGSR